MVKRKCIILRVMALLIETVQRWIVVLKLGLLKSCAYLAEAQVDPWGWTCYDRSTSPTRFACCFGYAFGLTKGWYPDMLSSLATLFTWIDFVDPTFGLDLDY